MPPIQIVAGLLTVAALVLVLLHFRRTRSH